MEDIHGRGGSFFLFWLLSRDYVRRRASLVHFWRSAPVDNDLKARPSFSGISASLLGSRSDLPPACVQPRHMDAQNSTANAENDTDGARHTQSRYSRRRILIRTHPRVCPRCQHAGRSSWWERPGQRLSRERLVDVDVSHGVRVGLFFRVVALDADAHATGGARSGVFVNATWVWGIGQGVRCRFGDVTASSIMSCPARHFLVPYMRRGCGVPYWTGRAKELQRHGRGSVMSCHVMSCPARHLPVPLLAGCGGRRSVSFGIYRISAFRYAGVD